MYNFILRPLTRRNNITFKAFRFLFLIIVYIFNYRYCRWLQCNNFLFTTFNTQNECKSCKRDVNGVKNVTKYSIHQSQTTFMFVGPTVTAVEEHIENLKKKGEPIQPFVIVVGALEKPREVLVYFDEI